MVGSNQTIGVPFVAVMWPCARLGSTVHAHEEALCPSM